ncbi:MAG TPA: phage major capsid protein [Rhodospirillaceae bacterium]|nr:phage major capsid protein [Rhodospirillaceae bacterium]
MIDMNEVQASAETLAHAFEEYKSVNDMRLAEMERKGSADVLTTEKLGRLDDAINKIQTDLSGVKTALRRPNAGGIEAKDAQSEDGEYKSAFMRYVTKGIEPDLQGKAMSTTVDESGGYMLPTELSGRIISKQFDTTPMRQIATVMSISTDAVEMLRDTSEAEAQWVSELAARTDTEEGVIGRIRIPAHELYAQPKATQKLLDDSVLNVEEWLVGRVAGSFARKENLSFVSGDGVNQPRGFLSYTTAATSDAARTWGVLEHVATGADGTFNASTGADVLISLMNKLKAGYLPKATWLMPRSVVDAVRKFKESGTGAYIWQPSLQTGTPATLLGYPIMLADDMPSMASGSLSVAFGNFEEGYTIVDRIGLQTLRDPYTSAPFVKFRCTKRVGGDVVNFDAIKVLKFGTV